MSELPGRHVPNRGLVFDLRRWHLLFFWRDDLLSVRVWRVNHQQGWLRVCIPYAFTDAKLFTNAIRNWNSNVYNYADLHGHADTFQHTAGHTINW